MVIGFVGRSCPDACDFVGLIRVVRSSWGCIEECRGDKTLRPGPMPWYNPQKPLGSAPPRRNGGEEHLKEAGGHCPELMQQLVKVRLGRPLLAEPFRAVGARPGNEPGR